MDINYEIHTQQKNKTKRGMISAITWNILKIKEKEKLHSTRETWNKLLGEHTKKKIKITYKIK